MPTETTLLSLGQSEGGALWQPAWLPQGESLTTFQYPLFYLQLLKGISPPLSNVPGSPGMNPYRGHFFKETNLTDR